MEREYHKWFSPNLRRNMELLVFGHAGAKVLLFPTRTARFYDYENWKVIESLRHHIEQGWIQLYCLDSIDQESFYCFWAHPQGRIFRHIEYIRRYSRGFLMRGRDYLYCRILNLVLNLR